MAHIYVYSPSGAVRDKTAFRRAVQRLQALGHAVEVDPDALASHERFAGDDATRLAAIRRAAHSGADVALMSRGGYGLTRILADLPYKALQKAIQNGTRFVGLSDFTALQMALLAKTGPQAVTWAGNLLVDDWGKPEGTDEVTQACFEEMLDGSGEGAGWHLGKREEADADLGILKKPVMDATLWGGNLCVLSSLVGTPYMPAIEKGVLFLEDVGEHPYRIERMLTQLLHAGVLDRQKAVVLGQFTDYRLGAHDKGYSMKGVLRWLRSQTRTPVITGLPHGHVATKVLLPVGASVSLLAPDRERFLVWGHQ